MYLLTCGPPAVVQEWFNVGRSEEKLAPSGHVLNSGKGNAKTNCGLDVNKHAWS